MENKEYYTPDISDIRIGYECEILSYKEGEKEDWNTFILDLEKTKICLCILSTTSDKDTIRVPYLTKEQIEKEGWNWNEQYYNNRFSKKSKRLDGVEQVFELKYDYNTRILEISYDCGEYMNAGIFEGRINSINEFRIICKLLEI